MIMVIAANSPMVAAPEPEAAIKDRQKSKQNVYKEKRTDTQLMYTIYKKPLKVQTKCMSKTILCIWLVQSGLTQNITRLTYMI